MELYFNPLDRACKSQTGAIPRLSNLTLNLYCKRGGEETFSAESCTLSLNRDGLEPEYLPMTATENGWTITLRFHHTGLYFYHFCIGNRHFGCGQMRKGTFTDALSSWQITVHKENYVAPSWFKGGVMYQIFPDRFNKVGNCQPVKDRILREWGELPYFRPNAQGKILNNDFFGGDINGIREKLDYLKLLGVTVLYLNPIFESPSNHRYDTGDYMKVDAMLGTEKDLDALVEAASQRGMRIILDGVFNHTGADSRYFNRFGHYDSVGAYQSKDSPYAAWYNFHPFPQEYDCWWGIATLPAVNEAASSYQEFVLGHDGVIKNWLRHGIGGWRLDVADELPDFFLKKLRTSVKEENPEALIIGEVWEDASNKISYGVRREYFQGEELDSVMNYPLKNAIIHFMLSGNTEELRYTIATLIDNYPKSVLDSLMNILGTHDTARILTVLGGKHCANKEEMAVTWLTEDEKECAKSLQKMAVLLQFTLPGVPCIYYGDEIGMEGYADPFCRRTFDWTHLDAELIAFYAKLGDIRRCNTAFYDGDYREVFADGGCIVFERKNCNQAVYVYVNRSDCKYQISFEGEYTEQLSETRLNDGKLSIGAQEYGIISK